MDDASDVYARYCAILKTVVSFQCYVRRRYLDTGLLEPFPRLVLHAPGEGRGAEPEGREYEMPDYHVHAHGTTTDVEGYINLYAARLCGAVSRRTGRAVKAVSPYTVDQNWRVYIDGVVESLLRGAAR